MLFVIAVVNEKQTTVDDPYKTIVLLYILLQLAVAGIKIIPTYLSNTIV